MYSVSYLNKLINSNKIIMLTELKKDKSNIVFTGSKQKEVVLKNLDKLNLSFIEKDKVEIIDNYYFNDTNKKFNKNNNLEKFFNITRNYTKNHYEVYINKSLNEIKKDYNEIDSIIYTQLIYQVTQRIEFLKQEQENINSKYKQELIKLVLNTKAEAKNIIENEIDI